VHRAQQLHVVRRPSGNPPIGWPAHSTITSICGCDASACESSPMWVVPSLIAASCERAAGCSGVQATRTGLPCAARRRSFEWRRVGAPRMPR